MCSHNTHTHKVKNENLSRTWLVLFIPPLERQSRWNLFEFKVSLVFIVCSRTAKVSKKPVSKRYTHAHTLMSTHMHTHRNIQINI